MTYSQRLLKTGKLAATKFFNLIKKSGSWIQKEAKPIIDGIKSKAGDIAKWISSINMKAFNKKILDYSYGWVAFPKWAITGIDGILKQAKAFFTQMAVPPPGLVHTTKKEIKGYVKELTFQEEEEAKKLYNSGQVDKEDYPTETDYIEAQIKLKNQKELMNKEREKMSNAIRNVGDQLNQKAIKNVLAWMNKKEGNEIKLWSKYDGVVKLVQQAVGVKPDGSFGTDTENAVKIAQKKHGLSQDGVVGPETWKKLTATNFRT